MIADDLLITSPQKYTLKLQIIMKSMISIIIIKEKHTETAKT